MSWSLGKDPSWFPLIFSRILHNCVGTCYLHLLGRAMVIICASMVQISFHVISLYLLLHSFLDFLRLLLTLVACLLGSCAFDGNVKSQQLMTQ